MLGAIAAHYVEAAAGGSYSDEVLADSPLWRARHGEPSGTTMLDSSGNSRNGSYEAVTLGVPGLLVGDTDTALSLPGSTASYGYLPYAAWMDAPTAFTAEAWIKTSAATIQSILDRDAQFARVWQFRLNAGAFEFIKISGGVVSASSGALGLNDGNPHHLCATYDGSNIRLYVDGSLVKTQSAPGSLTGSGRLTVGANMSGGVPAQPFNGTIDEPAMYGTVLSDTRIAAHYAAGTGS